MTLVENDAFSRSGISWTRTTACPPGARTRFFFTGVPRDFTNASSTRAALDSSGFRTTKSVANIRGNGPPPVNPSAKYHSTAGDGGLVGNPPEDTNGEPARLHGQAGAPATVGDPSAAALPASAALITLDSIHVMAAHGNGGTFQRGGPASTKPSSPAGGR